MYTLPTKKNMLETQKFYQDIMTKQNFYVKLFCNKRGLGISSLFRGLAVLEPAHICRTVPMTIRGDKPMMYEQEQDNYIVDHIIHLMNFLQENHLDMDQVMSGADQKILKHIEKSPDFLTAYEIVCFMNEMPGGFIIYFADSTEQIIYANRAALQIFQCDTMAEFRSYCGNSFRGLIHPEDLEEVEQSIQFQISNSQASLDYVEYRTIRKDGEIRWIEDYGRFIHSNTFQDIFYVFISDATEKHNRQIAERESLIHESNLEKQKYQTMIQEFDKERTLINGEYLRRLEVIQGLSVNYESIFYADIEQDQIVPYRLSGRCQAVYDESVPVYVLSRFMSRYINAWVHPEDQELVYKMTSLDYMREKLSDSQTFYMNFRVANSGEVQYLQLRVVNVGRADQVSQIVIGFRRVDEELQQEMEQKQMLAEALDNAKRAINAKDAFLSNMSHDIRTPLNAIFGFANLAKQNCKDPEAVRGYVERIETASKQLLDLVNKVLELAQTESGQIQAVETPCDLCSTIQEIFDFLKPQAVDKSIAFSLDFSQVSHKMVYCDYEKMKQLVLYLTNNAVTYTKPGGKVSITLAERENLPNQYAVFQLIVEDTGIGISQDFIKRIFEPFSREKNTTLSGIHGIGLGLTIAKSIVDMMGGTIDVESEVGKGSSFTITLRLRLMLENLSVHSEPASSDEETAEIQAGCQNILLVEDNEINLEIETEILQGLGFTVETAINGKLAVEKVSSAQPGQFDLILMDIQMPVMDGWQAAKEIRSLENPELANIPMIALSANVFESDVKKSIESGMNAHLPKPLDVGILLDTIDKLIHCL